ncbi:MAG: calcineurin-like phosphoesterase C-terminal domain-containing protein [Alistipes sp.]|nr:calcineurin-like phosphoesterase C-terminal domain-containing protein [Alistipes sp.]
MFKKGLFVAIVLLLLGCQADVPTEVVNGEGVTSLTLSLPETRTALGEKSGDTYPVYWSEDDKIVANGVVSDVAKINAANPASAEFSFDTVVTYPLSITYPYASTSTADAPKVVFPAEQAYVEGTFASGCAPMCGYVTNSSAKVTMKHLSGVLRFVINTKESGVALSKIVVSSASAMIAGEFAVNCTSGAIQPSASASNRVTYTLPSNFTLSTSQDNIFYITLPAVEQGECSVEFVEASGDSMHCVWSSSTPITAGNVREFSPITYTRGTVGTLAPMESEEDEFYLTYTARGYVRDNAGNPIKGVAVSDGFKVTTTDENGYYFLNVSRDCWYIFISLPAEYEVPINNYGQPCFFKKYSKTEFVYDFTLTPLAGGKEKRFALFAFGDPQVTNDTALSRFKTEAVPGIKKHANEVSATGLPCYGITLGDIISNGTSNNDEAYRDDMRDGFAASQVGLPVFQVMGNHDQIHCNESKPLEIDSRSSTIQIKHQRNFEDMFGPVNYSFNRGDVHIVGMRDISYNNGLGGGHTLGFSNEQVEWLRQDLALVPKSKMVVLCVHIQILNSTKNNANKVVAMLNEFQEAHIISGHTHVTRNYEHSMEGLSTKNVMEHNSGAVCGRWWSSNIGGDGTPNGFQVFIGDKGSKGGTFSDWYFIGYHEGQNTRDHQMRLYRGDAVTGRAITGTNTYNVKGYYGFNYAEDYLIANIYNVDKRWKIEVYEDGVYSGDMTRITSLDTGEGQLIGSYTAEDPRRFPDGVDTYREMYCVGLNLGILGSYSASGPGTGAFGKSYNLHKYKLKNKNAKIMVKATDRFGNVYTETKITEGTDYSITYGK